MKLLDTLANAFPVWVLVACGLALVQPELFTWFRGNSIVVGLAVIMLGMGLTLSIDDFRRVASRPGAVVAGFVGQFECFNVGGLESVNTVKIFPDSRSSVWSTWSQSHKTCPPKIS